MLDPTLGAQARDDEDFWAGLRPVDALTERFLGHYDDAVLSGWHLVGYESLVTRPGSVIDDLRAASGLAIAFDPGAAWQRVEFDYLQSSRTAEKAWRSELWGKPVDATRIGVHRRLLSRHQIERIEQRCSDYLKRWQSLSGADIATVGGVHHD
jgi:hypothetical protein